ncbi:hypothetical protein Vi05172_g12791 [Venturia inaequalis]|nr:hypothetical protein Vi05172_g12791 [Venturia inaequalis]
MVFCGKPSPACGSCRQRRIKCDLKKPGCSQCSNASTICPGYRNVLDLCFRDESQAVARKVQKKQKHLAVQSRGKPRTCKSPSPTLDPALVSSDLCTDFASFDLASAISKTLTLPIEEIATSHFFSTYVPDGHFHYLPQLYSDIGPGSSLFPVVHAVAIANLSREMRAPELQAEAQFQYARALAATNCALACPQQAVEDSTLASVLLLSLFETMTQQYRQMPSSWSSHIEGATALLKMRGLEQFDSKLGSQLYIQVSSSIRISSAQRCTRVPADFLDFNEMALPFLDANNPTLRVSLLVDAFARFREAVANKNFGDSGFIIDTALQLDQSVLMLLSTLPDGCDYEVIHLAKSEPGVFEGITHKYRDHRVAQLWNSLRMIRIFLNEAAHREISALIGADYESYGLDVPTEWILLQEMCARNAQRIASDICASVPQFTKLSPGQPLAVATAAFLLWPLSAAGESYLSPEPLRLYAIDRLKFLGREARLPQALWAAQMLEEHEKLEDWLHMYHLG